jgi:hypothetical protein
VISYRFYHARQTRDNEERFLGISGRATAQSLAEDTVIAGRRKLPFTPTFHSAQRRSKKGQNAPRLIRYLGGTPAWKRVAS